MNIMIVVVVIGVAPNDRDEQNKASNSNTIDEYADNLIKAMSSTCRC